MKFLSFSSLPFSLPSFPFSPETPDTQAILCIVQMTPSDEFSYANVVTFRADVLTSASPT